MSYSSQRHQTIREAHPFHKGYHCHLFIEVCDHEVLLVESAGIFFIVFHQPLFYSENVGRRLGLFLGHKKIGNELSTELLRALDRSWEQTVTPHLACSLKSGDKSSSYYTIWDILELHYVPVLLPMLHRIGGSIT
ncbi:hypothetical protein LguiB_025570 [Lonicera macranthoides]